MQNLRNRRASGHVSTSKLDYKELLSHCHVGNSVLDVGCGDMHLKKCLPDQINYFGLDPFPVDDTVNIWWPIETESIPLKCLAMLSMINTVCAFAVMDGCKDFNKACHNMQILAGTNVIFLTGIGIDPDQYHTLRLELSDFDEAFSGWKNTVRMEVSPKVWLLEYTRV